jgi:hypothetical protein
MAYPVIDAPYGLRPTKLLAGQAYPNANIQLPVASGYATAIYYGDVVMLTTDGTIVKDTGTTAATPIGVFVGCSYTDPSMGYLVHRNFLPAGIVAADIKAYIVDDPRQVFSIAVVSSGTTIGGVTRAAVGKNTALVQNAGEATYGNSRVAASATPATTATLPLRIVGVVEETKNSSGEYTEILVKWNAGMHQYDTALGV